MVAGAGNHDKSKKYLSLVLVMYAIKLKSDTENQRCIKDHQGHNTKTWPNVPCGPGASGPAAKLCRERETQIPEECDIFCCNEQFHDFMCHSVAYSVQKGICRMYDIEMDRYQEYVDDYGLVRKNPEKGEDWMYFFRQWSSQLHDVLNFTMAESIREENSFLEFEWLPVYKAAYYKIEIKTFVNFDDDVFDDDGLVVHGLTEPMYEIDTDSLPYNSIFNITITAISADSKTQSEDLVVEFLTRPPPITNLTLTRGHIEVQAEWLTKPGADYFEVKWYKSDSGVITDEDVPLKHFTEFSGNLFKQKVEPVQGYVLQIRSVGVNFFGNVSEGEWREEHLFSEFPPLSKLKSDHLGCDTATFSWIDVGFNASYRIDLYDLDRKESVSSSVTRKTNFQLLELLNAQKYLASIFAFNKDTRGDGAEAGFITQLCSPQHVHSPHQKDTALEIEWNTVHLADYYRIKIHPPPSDGFVDREVKPAQAYIEALTPGIQYTIKIYAHVNRAIDNVHIQSEAGILTQYTKLLAPDKLCINNRALHNSTATLFWEILGGADFYYLVLKTCKAPSKHILRPGFSLVQRKRCPRWKNKDLKCEKLGVSWDMSSKYLMRNITAGTPKKGPAIFELTTIPEKTFADLAPGQIYKIWLGGVNKQTYSEYAEHIFVTRLKTTTEVRSSQLTHESVHIDWDNIEQAASYSIIVTTDDIRRKRVRKISVKDPELKTDIGKLHPNFPYLIEVIGENQISFSWPYPINVRTKLAPTQILSPYKVPRGEEIKSNEMLILWSQVEGANYYEIEIYGPDGFYQKHEVLPLNLDGHRYVAKGLKHNSEHRVIITAFNKFIDGSKTTETFFTRPNTPSNFHGREVYDDTVTLAWNPVDGIQKYDIHVYDESRHLDHIVIENKTSHRFEDLIANHHYIFVIRAYGHVVSDPATLKLYTKITGVDYLAMNEVFDDTMTLDWKDANGATRYVVEFSFPGGEVRSEDTSTSSIELNDLVPNSIYDITVIGMNLNTAGMPMYLKVITKLGYIKDLHQDIRQSSHTTMMINWLQVPNADHFILKVTNKKNNKRVQVHKISADLEALLLENLKPATQYNVEIQAFSSISDSYPTDFEAQTKITPIAGFTVDFVSDILLRLVWNSYPDITYHIEGDKRKWTVHGEDSCWIPALLPDTEYEFTIHGTRDIYYSDNATVSWLTHMYAPTVKVEHRTHTTIKLSWSAVEEAEQYRVQYVETYKMKKVQEQGGSKRFRPRYQLSDSLMTVVRNLEPYTQYSFFVRAERGQQIGENGTELEFTKLSPTQNVDVKDRTDKTTRLSWQDVHGATAYTILYQAQFPVKNEELSVSVVGTRHKLTKLLPGSTYKLQIIAEAKETSGHPKQEKFDTYLETPINIQTVDYHTTAIRICWDAVPMAQGYTIHYGSLRPEDRTARMKDFVEIPEWKDEATGIISPCGFLDDLLPGLMYQYTIWGWNTKYDGLRSKYNSASLLEAPTNLHVKFHNNTVIEVQFDSVVRAAEYEISHIVHNEQVHLSVWDVDGKTANVLYPVSALTPFVNYDIRVLPSNKVTRGYNSTVNQWSKLNPITNFKPLKLTPNEITLTWDAVEYATFYRVFYQSVRANETMQVTDYAGIMIVDLEETTLYNITIEPVAENLVPGVRVLHPVITEARTVEDLEITVIEPWRVVVEWTGTEKAIAYEVHVNSTQYDFIMRVRTNRAYIRQLEPGILQTLKISVITKLTRSQPVMVKNYTTLPTPDSARIKKITHSAVKAEWNEALEDWAPAYPEIYYRCVIIKDSSNATVINETTTNLKYRFKELELNTRYTVMLQTQSPYTKSEIRVISVRTLLPDSPDLDMGNINDDQITISWNKTVGLDYSIWLRPMSRPGDLIIECEVSETIDVDVNGLISGCLYELVIYGQICPKDRKLTVEDDLKRIADQMFYTKLEDVEDIMIDEDDVSANMSWTPVFLADYYIVRWWDDETDVDYNMTKTSLSEELNIDDLAADTLYKGEIAGINADTKSDPIRFRWHTKMEAMEPRMILSSESVLHYTWEAVDGADEYVLQSMAQFAGEDPINAVIRDTSFKFENLQDGSEYLIQMYANNEDTDSVVKYLNAWTNLILPQVTIVGFEDNHFELRMKNVPKANGFLIMVNANNYTVNINDTIQIDENGNIPEVYSSFELKNLEQGSTQNIAIKAINDNTTSHFVEEKIVLLLNTPTDVTVIPADSSIHMTWKAVDKASSYRVSLETGGVFTNATIDTEHHTFYNLKSGLMYSMTIQAVNDVTKSRYVTVKAYTRLETVTGIKLDDVEPTWFSLSWIKISSATEYVITIIEHENTALNITEETTFEFVTNGTLFVVDDLNPGTKHTYSVAGRNKDTISDAAKFSLYTELEDIQELHMEGILHNELTAVWGQVPNAKTYQVILYDANNAELDTESIDANLFYDNNFRFSNLNSGKYYKVSVQAFNDVTFSNIEYIEQYTRLQPFKSNSVRVTENRPNGFIVTWNAINEASQYQVTIVKDWVNTYFMDEPNTVTITYTTNITEFDIPLLSAGTTYKFTVTAMNENAQSEPFLGYKTTLLPDILGSVINNVTFASLQAHWKPVPGAIDYLVQLRVNNGPILFLTSIFKPEIALRFGSVKPGIEYMITIIGKNEKTETRPLSRTQWTHLSPMSGLQIVWDELEEDSVVLSWDKTEKATYYQINVTDPELGTIIHYDRTNTTLYTRSNLTAGTEYKFSIAAVNENTRSEPDTITVITPLSKPTSFEPIVLHPNKIIAQWKLGDREAPKHRRVTWRCNKPAHECTCTDFRGCSGHFKLRKNRFDGERTWTPQLIGDTDYIEDHIELDNNMTYRACIRAENPQTEQSSNSYCVTFVTGSIIYAKTKNDVNRICIEREANWFEPLEQIPAILNNGLWKYETLQTGDIMAGYDDEKVSTCKKIGKAHNWDLKDFIRIDQHKCAPGWYVVDDDLVGSFEASVVKVPCKFTVHKNGSPIFPKDVLTIDYCHKRNVDPKRPWVALKNVANGQRCGCYFLKPCERWDYKPFPGFTVKNAAPLTALPMIKKQSKCLERCDEQRERECLKIPKFRKEGKTNCVCKDCCLMTTHNEETGCVLYSSSLNRTKTSLISQDQSTVFTNFLGSKGMSGFRLIDWINNGVAKPNIPYTLTLTFSYVSETCIKFVFDSRNDTQAVYHDLIIRKYRDYAKMKPCIETYPATTFYPVEHVLDYDLEDTDPIVISETFQYQEYGIYESYIEITSTDDDQVGDVEREERIVQNVGINSFGCQYPSVKIEGPWLEGEVKTYILPKSKKLILSATENVICEANPGYEFKWKAKLISFDSNMELDGNGTLEEYFAEREEFEYIVEGSGEVSREKILAEKLEAAIQPRELAEGLWKVTIELKLIELDIDVSDTVWISVIPSPLEIDIEGGERRTVGHGKTVQFLATAIDPDENDGVLTQGIDFKWFVLGVNQTEMKPADQYFTAMTNDVQLLPAHLREPVMDAKSYPQDEMFEIRSENEVRLSTNFFPMNEAFEIILVCTKDIRTKTFRQKVVAVAGDPPDFFIKCVENCKEKLNRGQTLSLMIRCKNCARARRPRFNWQFHLHDLVETEDVDDYDYEETSDYSSSQIVAVAMQPLTDVPSMTDSFTQRIMKVAKRYFLSGREYTIDVSVSMDGYDEETNSIVRQEAENNLVNKVNLPPKDGYCTVETDTCDYITNEFYELVPNENSTARIIYNTSETECSSSCCYGESLNCLAYQYSAWEEDKTGNCTLFDVTEDDDTVDMIYVYNQNMISRFNRRVFAKVEAVKGEVSFVCKDWIDEGTYLTYEEAEGRQAQLMFRFSTVPLNSSVDPFLLYHGPSPKTPKLSLPLGEEHYYFFGLRIMAEICDAYGECVESNEILVQALPMVSADVGLQLMDTVSGNSSKLLTATSTKNAKIVAAITGAVSSYLTSNITLSQDVIEATKATLLSTTSKPINRMIYSGESDSPVPTPAHLDTQNNLAIFDISSNFEASLEESGSDDETIESEGISHSDNLVKSKEQQEQEQENKRLREVWQKEMAHAAHSFIDSALVSKQVYYRKRRSALPPSEIKRRLRRNEEFYYDDYQVVGEDYSNYSFDSFTDYDYNSTYEEYVVEPTVEMQASMEIATDMKKSIKKNLMAAMGSVVDVVVSPESLLQVSDAISSFTGTGDDMDEETQTQGAEIATRMTSNLKTFTDEADKEQMSKIGTKVMNGLSGIVSSSTPDDSALQKDKLSGKEPNYKDLENLDENPKENEWRRKFDRLKNRAEIKEKSGMAKNITQQSLKAVMDVGAAINTKQMMDEPAGEVKSGSLGITTEKINKEDLSNKKLKNSAGVSIKMPKIIKKTETQTVATNAQSSLGEVEINEDEEVDIQMSTFDNNPLKYGDDAALMNSPVTVLNMPNGTEDILSQGITIEVPNSFSAENQMLELHFPDENRTQISRFEIVGPGNAILYLLEPPEEPGTIYNYEVYFRSLKPPELGEYPVHDFNFTLPHDLEIWEMDNPEVDKYKIFIPEDIVHCNNMYPCSWYVGVKMWTVNITDSTMGIKRRRRRTAEDNENKIHHVFLSTPGCRVFDQETASWESQGCRVDHRSTPEHTECFCKDLPQQAVFSTQFFVPPNKIDFSTIWTKVCIGCNPGVFSFVIVFISLWLILAYFIYGMDKKDQVKWQLRSLIDNRRRDTVSYQITACTGHYADSPTKSKVYFVLNGEQSSTKVRRLGTTKTAQLFDRSETKHFLMRAEKDLGEIKSLQIWHDNTGSANLKGWYAQQVVVTHVPTGKRWFFMINDYLDAARGDGKCERMLPPSNPDDGTNFHDLFVGTLSAKLTDDHIWLSVFYRPNRSNFTRFQRWTCCSGLTFITMLANVMWSGQNDESTMIRIGPFKFSPTAVWISFCASLISVPPVIMAITLFKRARSKKETSPEKEPGCSNIKFPYWVKYISYFLNFAMTIVCAFFTILYSFEFGKERADKWLLDELMSFAQNIILIEPCKVAFISLGIAMILRKLDNSFLDSVESHEIEEEEKRFLDLCSFEAEIDSQPLLPPKPPTEKQLSETKEVRYKEERMVEVIYDLIAYACYICIVIFIATGNRDHNAYGQNENIRNHFYYGDSGFEQVSSIDDFWTWVNTTVRTDLYPKTWSNGEKLNWRDRAFLKDGYSFRVGPARVRLQRGDPWSCKIFDYEKYYMDTQPRDRCDRGEEVKGDYAVGWTNELDSNNVDEDNILEQSWIYRTWQELNGAPFQGKIGVHDGGGYSAELGVNQETCSFIVNHLYENAWIDHSATVTFVEFTIYNVNTNLFSQVRFASEWLPSGGSSNSFAIKTFRLYHYTGSLGAFMMAAQVIFMLHLVYKIYSTIRHGFVKLGISGVLANGWQCYEVMMIILDTFILIFYTVRLVISDKTIAAFEEDKRSYVNFDPVVVTDQTLGAIISFAVFFSILKFAKMLRFNQRIDMLMLVIKKIGNEWPGFMGVFFIVTMGFIQAALTIWNKYSMYFGNLITASETLLDGMLGGVLYDKLTEAYPTLGAFFYLTFCFTEMFLILNVLCAIINTSCELGSEYLAEAANEYEIMDFMFKKMKTHPALGWLSGEKEEPNVDEKSAEIQLRIERIRSKRIESLRKREIEAMQTYESCMKSLNRLDSMNIEQKLGLDPQSKYTED